MFNLIFYIFKLYFLFAKNNLLEPQYWGIKPNFYLRAIIFFKIFIPNKGKDKSFEENIKIAIEEAGIAYIKFCQFLATRPDIIGIKLAKTMRQFQSSLSPIPQKEIEEIIFSANVFANKTNKEAEEINGYIPPGYHSEEIRIIEISKVIATASIAQVHKIKIDKKINNQDEFIIKILIPNRRKNINKNKLELEKLALFLNNFAYFKRLKPKLVIKQFVEQLNNECDLILEAHNLVQFKQIIKKHKIAINTPNVISELSCEKFIVLTEVKGEHLTTEFIDANFSASEKEKFAKILLEQFFYSAFYEGFFHADLHQSNILLSKDGVISMIDFGITDNLSLSFRYNLAKIIICLTKGDYINAAIEHKNIGFIAQDADLNKFAARLAFVVEPIRNKKIDEINSKKLIFDLFAITKEFSMQTQIEIVKLEKTMVALEGILRLFSQNLDYWKISRPILENYMVFHHRKNMIKELFADVPKIIQYSNQHKNKIKEVIDLLSLSGNVEILKNFFQNRKENKWKKYLNYITIFICLMSMMFISNWVVLKWLIQE